MRLTSRRGTSTDSGRYIMKADRARNGSSAITVHPRTDFEIDSARTHPAERPSGRLPRGTRDQQLIPSDHNVDSRDRDHHGRGIATGDGELGTGDNPYPAVEVIFNRRRETPGVRRP